MTNNLVIQICPHEPMSCMSLLNGESVRGSEYEADLRDCIKTGDCQQACEYVLDHIGVTFCIVAKDGSGKYENRLATRWEMQATCEAIYFELDSDFTDMRLAQICLVWDAASELDSDDIYN
jgi:hypothetical protein